MAGAVDIGATEARERVDHAARRILAGRPVLVCAATELRGFAWLSNDDIVLAPIAQSSLMRVSANGGNLVQDWTRTLLR
jgi:hypothetical protein